jgi:hypothetical protein
VRHGERASAVAEKDVDIAAGSDSEIWVAVAVEIAGGSCGSSGEHSYRLTIKCPIAVAEKHCATSRNVELPVIVEIRNQDTGVQDPVGVSAVDANGDGKLRSPA